VAASRLCSEDCALALSVFEISPLATMRCSFCQRRLPQSLRRIRASFPRLPNCTRDVSRMQCKGTEKSETAQAFLNFISNVKMSRNKTFSEHGATVQRCNIPLLESPRVERLFYIYIIIYNNININKEILSPFHSNHLFSKCCTVAPLHRCTVAFHGLIQRLGFYSIGLC